MSGLFESRVHAVWVGGIEIVCFQYFTGEIQFENFNFLMHG